MNILDGLPEGTLSPDGEDQLARDIEAKKSWSALEAALNKLVLWTMREAFKYVKGVCRGKLNDGEILSLCYEALTSSAKQFKPGQQRFLAYAKPNLRGHIARHWQALKVVKHSITEPIPDLRRSPNVDVLSESCHPATSPPPIFCVCEPSVEQDFDALHSKERWARIAPLVEEVLNEQEKMIITLRYTSGMNFEETGELLGVSRAAVQRTHTRALEKIRIALAENPALLKD